MLEIWETIYKLIEIIDTNEIWIERTSSPYPSSFLIFPLSFLIQSTSFPFTSLHASNFVPHNFLSSPRNNLTEKKSYREAKTEVPEKSGQVFDLDCILAL